MTSSSKKMQLAAAGNAGGGFEDNYFMYSVKNGSVPQIFDPMIDPDTGDVVSISNRNSTTGITVTKVSNDGTLAFSRKHTFTEATNFKSDQSNGGVPRHSSLDSNGDIIVLSITEDTNDQEIVLSKFSGEDGSLIWQKISAARTYNTETNGNSMCVDGTDIYTIHMMYDGGNTTFNHGAGTVNAHWILIKYDSSGSIQFQKYFRESTFATSTTFRYGKHNQMKVYGGKLYIVGRYNLTGTGNYAGGFSVDLSSFAVDDIICVSGDRGATGIDFDDSGNIYLSAVNSTSPYEAGSPSSNFRVYKFGPTGSDDGLWYYWLNSPQANEATTGVRYLPDTDEVIAVGPFDELASSWYEQNDCTVIVNLDASNGSQNFRRKLRLHNDERDYQVYGLDAKQSTFAVIQYASNTTNGSVVAVLPTDGTLTGSYSTGDTGFSRTVTYADETGGSTSTGSSITDVSRSGNWSLANLASNKNIYTTFSNTTGRSNTDVSSNVYVYDIP